MGSSPSKQLAQFPAGCGLCKTAMTITSKCLKCNILLCENCRHQHLKTRNSYHRVMYIKDIGKKLEILSVKTFTSNWTYINCILPDEEFVLWISCNLDRVLYHIQLQDNDFTIIKKIKIKVIDMARLSENKILLSIGRSRLKLLDTETGDINDSVYDVSPFQSLGFNITKDNNIIIGCYYKTMNGFRSVVMVLDMDGNRMAVYEHYEDMYNVSNVSIFIYPRHITSTSNGNIHVADYNVSDSGGRVFVLDRDGSVITMYKGHPNINRDFRFRPIHIVTTPADRVVVADPYSNSLHILDNTGQLVTFISTEDKGILYPVSLVFMDDGHLLIGCINGGTMQDFIGTIRMIHGGKKDAKLHKAKISDI